MIQQTNKSPEISVIITILSDYVNTSTNKQTLVANFLVATAKAATVPPNSHQAAVNKTSMPAKCQSCHEISRTVKYSSPTGCYTAYHKHENFLI